jgi:hypothetical protein
MTPAERIGFLSKAIEEATVGSPEWLFLIESFIREFGTLIEVFELAAAEPVTEAKN